MTHTAHSLKKELENLTTRASAFFDSAESALGDLGNEDIRFRPRHERSNWELLSEELHATSDGIRVELVKVGIALLDAAKSSPLLGESDFKQIRLLLRQTSASLRLKKFEHHDPYVLSEEDRYLGLMPEEEVENDTTVEYAVEQFQRASARLIEKLDFMLPSADRLASAMVASETAGVRKYKRNTVFIMMQIDDKNPHLEDVKLTIKDVFKCFGIDAVRSDEIEHQDVLTQRILDEIATSEFLIADLTGERPSVYYEVGYADACGKRPILFRQAGTRLHFDLSVHNVPEYQNITDLKNKLTKRLEAITNKVIEIS